MKCVNGKSNQNKGRRQTRKTKRKFSTREIEELMGVHGPRYERRRGALRQNNKMENLL